MQGENPVYVWVPLTRYKKKRKAGSVDEDEPSDLQVSSAVL